MNKIRSLFVAVLSFVALAHQANAAVIFDNGDPTLDNGALIGGGYEARDDFTIGGGGTISSVGIYFANENVIDDGIAGWDGSVSYNIFDSSGVSVLSSGAGQNVTAVQTSFPWFWGSAWLMEFDLVTPFSASAGAQYWLGITGLGGSQSYWITSAGTGGNSQLRFGGGSFDNGVGWDLAFFLEGESSGGETPLPMPGALALFTLGLLGLGLRRRTV